MTRNLFLYLLLSFIFIISSSLQSGAQTPKPKSPQEATGSGRIDLNPKMNIVQVFAGLAANPKNIHLIEFEPGTYHISGTLQLPRTKGLVIIEGNGSMIIEHADVPVFQSVPESQKQAMIWMGMRYDIRNFSGIQGGTKGVELGATYNTLIHNIDFSAQKNAAVDLIFCLMADISNVLVTNNQKDGIVLRTGYDMENHKALWPGAGVNNSQCNQTVVRSCRIYAGKGSDTGFKILQSSGVRLQDCIVEGFDNQQAVYYSSKGCTTAKTFDISNFHLENNPLKGGICLFNWGGMCEIHGFFSQMLRREVPTIWIMENGSYVLDNIPYWPPGAWIKTTASPWVRISDCAAALYHLDETWQSEYKTAASVNKKYFILQGSQRY